MTLQVAPRHDVDGFERYDLSGPELIVPFLLASGAAVGAGIAAWLGQSGWSAGEYNDWMRTMDKTLHNWDTLGWKYGCWKNEQLRKEFLAFWQRFSTHYKEHGIVSTYVSDAEEKPARAIMQQMIQWGTILNKCGAPIAIKTYEDEQKQKDTEESKEFDWGAALKWGAIGIGGLVALNLITGIRGAFSKQ